MNLSVSISDEIEVERMRLLMKTLTVLVTDACY